MNDLGLNVDMLDVDFLRRLSDKLDPSPASLRLRELADNLAKEIKDVGILRDRAYQKEPS